VHGKFQAQAAGFPRGMLQKAGVLRAAVVHRPLGDPGSGLENLESSYAGLLHGLQVSRDAIGGDVAVHPVPPGHGPRRRRRLTEGLFEGSAVVRLGRERAIARESERASGAILQERSSFHRFLPGGDWSCKPIRNRSGAGRRAGVVERLLTDILISGSRGRKEFRRFGPFSGIIVQIRNFVP